MSELFNITHEVGDLTEYDSTVTDTGDLSAHADAGIVGDWGLKCVIDDQTDIYGVITQAEPASNTIRLRFHIDPNGLTMGDTEAFDVLLWRNNTSGNEGLSVSLGYTAAAGYSITVVAVDDEDNLDKSVSGTITDAAHYVEILLEREATDGGGNGVLTVWFDGTQEGTVTTVDNWTRWTEMEAFRFGAVDDLDAGTSGTLWLDDLKANDSGTAIGTGAGFIITVNDAVVTGYIKARSIVVSEVASQTMATCAFYTRDHAGAVTISAKHPITITDDGVTLFGGKVATVDKGQEPGIAKEWKVKCQDNNIYLDDTVVEEESYAAATADDTMIADLFSTYLSAIATSEVAQIDASMEVKAFKAQTMRQILDEICATTGGRYYVDYDMVLHYFDGDEGNAASFSINTSPDDAASFGFSDFRLSERSTNMCNKVLVIGHGESGWVTDATSITAYGEIHGILRDNKINTAQGVTDRGTEYVAAYKDPLTTYMCWITKDGLRAGENLTVVNAVWGIDAALTVRKLTMKVISDDGVRRRYDLELDDERPSFTDALEKLTGRIAANENTLEESWYWDRDSATKILYPAASISGTPDHVAATWGGDIRTYSGNRTGLTFSVDGATGNIDTEGTLDVALTSILRGNVSLYSAADLLVYSNVAVTLKASIDGATGDIWGARHLTQWNSGNFEMYDGAPGNLKVWIDGANGYGRFGWGGGTPSIYFGDNNTRIRRDASLLELLTDKTYITLAPGGGTEVICGQGVLYPATENVTQLGWLGQRRWSNVVSVLGNFSGTVTTGALLPHTTATLDIGVTGTRYRDLFLSRNADIDGTLNVQGQGTFQANVDFGAGIDVTGNITVTGLVDTVDVAGHTHTTPDDVYETDNYTPTLNAQIVSTNSGTTNLLVWSYVEGAGTGSAAWNYAWAKKGTHAHGIPPLTTGAPD